MVQVRGPLDAKEKTLSRGQMLATRKEREKVVPRQPGTGKMVLGETMGAMVSAKGPGWAKICPRRPLVPPYVPITPAS